MPGKDFLKQSASDPERIRAVCAQAERIVLCMTDQHIGNFAISTPALKALQRGLSARAGVVVDVMVATGFASLAQRLLDPADLIPHDMPGTFPGDVAGLFRTRRRTRGQYDVLIGLSGGIRGSTLARLAGARATIGLDRHRRSGLYTLRIRDENPDHALGRYAQFGLCAGGAEPIIEPFSPLEGDAETLCETLQTAGIDPGEPLTIVHAGAGKAHRRWPVDRFALIADHAVAEHGHTVGILTPPGEEPEAEALLGAMRHADRARLLSIPLGQLLPLFDHAQALVCNESGPMHLAAMTRCAIVALFGPTDPKKWSPIRTGPEVAVLQGDPCPPECRGGQCVTGGACLTSISTLAVAEALDRTLAAASSLPDLART